MAEAERFEETLKEIGFSQNESRVYLALLELGSSNVGKIAQKSGVHRTNVYDALKNLSKRGLVSSVLKGNIRFYEGIDPGNLINLLKEKESRLSLILPQLRLKHSQSF